MKKMDEMDRNIQLHSEGLGYKVAILSLSLWIIFTSYQVIVFKAEFQRIPVLILCLTTSVQYFSRLVIKQQMVSGDDEYKEPNRVLMSLVLLVLVLAFILAIGTWFLTKER